MKDKAEGEAIQRALDDKELRAFVVIAGTLLPFSDRARSRILTFISDSVLDPDPALRAEDKADA